MNVIRRRGITKVHGHVYDASFVELYELWRHSIANAKTKKMTRMRLLESQLDTAITERAIECFTPFIDLIYNR